MNQVDLSYSNPLLAPTGRVKSFMEDPNRGTLPASCTMFRLQGSGFKHYQDLFYFAQKALVTGAGVSLHLSLFKPTKKGTGSLVSSRDQAQVVLEAQDSMDYSGDLEGSWALMDLAFAVYVLIQEGNKVYLDLSRVRSEGTLGSKGQVASGPDSFMEVYKAAAKFSQEQTITTLLSLLSKFNETIRRGGVYKNGAVVTHLPIWHPDFSEYALAKAPEVHPYLFKAAIVPQDWEDYTDQLMLCLERVNARDLWLTKVISSEDNVTWLKVDQISSNWDNTVGHNVCLEVLIPSRGTCIIMPINLGMAKDPQDLIGAFVEGMTFLAEFQKRDYQAAGGIYLSAKEDRQVALGLMGLANLLAHEGISFEDFTNDLEDTIGFLYGQGFSPHPYQTLGQSDWEPTLPYPETASQAWINQLVLAFHESAKVANSYGLKRAYGIAPTASVAFRYKDREGFSVCPEVSPPNCSETRKVERRSGSGDSSLSGFYQYPPNVEIASEVDKRIHFKLNCHLQELMDLTGQSHAISWNVWDSMDDQLLMDWLDSPLKSTYYLWETHQSYLNKSDQVLTPAESIGGSCGMPVRTQG